MLANSHASDISLFLEMVAAEKGAARNTILSYEKDLLDFSVFISPLSLREASKEAVESYLQSLAEKAMAPATQARRLSAIKQFYKFMISEELINHNPTQLLDTPKNTRSLPKTLTFEEVESLIKIAATDTSEQGIRLYCLLEMLYASGLRVTELVSLPMKVIPKDLTQLDQHQMLYIKGKGGRERLVPLGQHAIEALRSYLAIRPTFIDGKKGGDKWLFPSRSKEGYLTRQRFFQLLKELAAKVNIAPERLSPHVVRHAFATHLLQGGADLLSIQKLLGHADISTTQIYTHVVADHVVKLVEQHHPLAKRKI